MLVGPPGTGKSMAAAKLAAKAVMDGRKVAVISADAVRAGATAQLKAFTHILEIDLLKARNAAQLENLLDELEGGVDLIVVDSPGINPFKAEDRAYLADFLRVGAVEPILVLAAGGDMMENRRGGQAVRRHRRDADARHPARHDPAARRPAGGGGGFGAALLRRFGQSQRRRRAGADHPGVARPADPAAGVFPTDHERSRRAVRTVRQVRTPAAADGGGRTGRPRTAPPPSVRQRTRRAAAGGGSQ